MINDDQSQMLVQAAVEARKWAYAGYSNYQVGAALLTTSGKIYDGVNVENAVNNLGICAERVAVFKAVSEGERQFAAIAVVTSDGGSPCGACRQVLSEFGLDLWVLIVNQDGQVLEECQLIDLLPRPFSLP